MAMLNNQRVTMFYCNGTKLSEGWNMVQYGGME